jgi:GntR family transcriptional regulator, transcriptional repressor for pyruvate dehydrogenase complex
VAFRAVSLTRSYEQVVEQIQERIRSGALAPGQRLPTERELSESFGVSRAVVREALKVLTAMGLVESRQGSGTFVAARPVPSLTRALILSATPEEESLLALFEVREPLETLAARLAAERRTPEQAERIVAAAEESRRAAVLNDLTLFGEGDDGVHLGILAATGNPYLESIVGAVREMLSQGLRLAVGLAGAMAVAAEQHARIAAAIVGGDGDAAAALMGEHIRYTADALRELVAAGHRIDIGPLLQRR